MRIIKYSEIELVSERVEQDPFWWRLVLDNKPISVATIHRLMDMKVVKNIEDIVGAKVNRLVLGTLVDALDIS